jgi:fucose 4-O-acetylase-like acetyltransferase
MHYVMQVRRVRAPWLVVLGQNALVLYFVHQIIVLTLARQRLGVLFTSWWLYALANVALLVLLVGLGWLWPELKRRVRRGLQRGGVTASPGLPS